MLSLLLAITIYSQHAHVDFHTNLPVNESINLGMEQQRVMEVKAYLKRNAKVCRLVNRERAKERII